MKPITLPLCLALLALAAGRSHAEPASVCARAVVETSSPAQLARTLQGSLWLFHSAVWNGYIDFQGNGRYWTHWGYGRWKVSADGAVELQNDYDSFAHAFRVAADGQAFAGSRSDGVAVTGALVCGQYSAQAATLVARAEASPAPAPDLRDAIAGSPEPRWVRPWLRLFEVDPLGSIRAALCALPEMPGRAALACASAR